MTRTKSTYLAVLAVLLSPMAANADIIDQNGPSTGFNDSFPGVSLTTPTGGPWDTLLFNFFDRETGAPHANGDLFVLTAEYNGTPNDLSAGTLGFLAQSISAIGGLWQFDAGVTLEAATTYWFYVGGNFSWPSGAGRGGNGSAGEFACFADSANGNYDCFQADSGQWDYTLQGSIAVPEPGTLALLGLGLFGMGLSRRRKKA